MFRSSSLTVFLLSFWIWLFQCPAVFAAPQAASASASVPPTVQTASTSIAPTTGTVVTALETAGEPTTAPFNTEPISSPISTVKPSPKVLAASSAAPLAALSSNIFVPIASNAPPSNIPVYPNHPVPRQGFVTTGIPLATNKFYANFFLAGRNNSVFTHPYSLTWLGNVAGSGSYGLGISHVRRDQLIYGPGSPASYFINPLGVYSIIMSAAELGSDTKLTLTETTAFSVKVKLSTSSKLLVTFPILQGTGFTTGSYSGATPLFQSNVFFNKLTYVGTVNSRTDKYRVALNDGYNWLIYVTPKTGTTSSANRLSLKSTSRIQGPANFVGIIQVAKAPSSTLEKYYDASAGTYALTCTVSASVDKAAGTSTYSLSWSKGGSSSSNKLVMWALPHHVASMNSATSSAKTSIQLETTTKGYAVLVAANSITMVENIKSDLGFAPYSPTKGSVTTVSSSARAKISYAAVSELSQDFNAQTNLDTMYFSGKGLAKFAAIIWATNDIVKDSALAASGLAKLKTSFAVFVNNRQQHPLGYDDSWKGIVSSVTYWFGDPNADFGNTYYNDHHFHYGYFVYTAAVIAYLDPTWLNSTNKAYVDALVRDYANPVDTDPYFPFSRSFDWYHGHSWAKGLFDSFDSKDEESSSEDGFSLYAMKLWGKVTGDPNMEARGDLQLAVVSRSLQNYFLLKSNNQNQPSRFIGNKVTGILFENKVDHTTYFSTGIEAIEGIHMLPINPSSALTRDTTFVTEEWNTYFSNGRADAFDSGWKGVLYANLALIDPATSWKFFTSSKFNATWLDGGASRTWYLAYAAALGGL